MEKNKNGIIKIKIDTIFYYYYFSILIFSDKCPAQVSDSMDMFMIIFSKYFDTIMNYLEPLNYNDKEYISKILKIMKFVKNEMEKNVPLFVIRNLIVSNFSEDIKFILSHEIFKTKNFQSLEDLEFFIKQPTILKDFVKMLVIYVKNVLSIKHINVLTKTLIENISDTEIKNITKITQKFQEVLYDYLNEENLLTFNQVYLSKETIDEKLKETKLVEKFLNVERIYTGFQIFDSLTNGLQKGRVYLILGKTGQGKSSFLINLTKNFLESKKKILFYTFENTIEESMERLFSCITKIKLGEFTKYPQDVTKKIQEFFENSGTINIVYSPADTITVPMIKEKIKILGDVDIVIIDYLDLLKLSGRSNVEERIRTMKLVRQLKNLAQETNTLVITPSQIHRSAFRNKVVEVDNVSESFGKISEADGVFILESTIDDLQNNTIRLNIGKLRHGKSNVRIEMNVDFSTMTFLEKRIITDIDDILNGNNKDNDDTETIEETPKSTRKRKTISKIEQEFDFLENDTNF